VGGSLLSCCRNVRGGWGFDVWWFDFGRTVPSLGGLVRSCRSVAYLAFGEVYGGLKKWECPVVGVAALSVWKGKELGSTFEVIILNLKTTRDQDLWCWNLEKLGLD